MKKTSISKLLLYMIIEQCFLSTPGPDTCDGDITSTVYHQPCPHEVPVNCGGTEHTQKETLHVLVQTEGQEGGRDAGAVCHPEHHLPGELFPADAGTSDCAQGEAQVLLC